MNIIDFIVLGVIVAIMAGAITKIVKDKKKGVKCTGCSGCSANCKYNSNIELDSK